MSIEPTTLCLTCTCSNQWAIWPNEKKCLMVYRIKWPWNIVLSSAVAESNSHSELTFYFLLLLFSLRANFGLGPSPVPTVILHRIYFVKLILKCFVEFSDIYYIHIDLRFSHFMETGQKWFMTQNAQINSLVR